MGCYKNAVLLVIVLNILIHSKANSEIIFSPPLYLFWRGGSSTLDDNDDLLSKYYVPEVICPY